MCNLFAEYAPEPNPETKKKDVVWFALSDERPLFAFAGIWTTFNGDRGTKSKPVPGPHQVYGFRFSGLRCGSVQNSRGRWRADRGRDFQRGGLRIAGGLGGFGFTSRLVNHRAVCCWRDRAGRWAGRPGDTVTGFAA
jgi:hypothetical protein